MADIFLSYTSSDRPRAEKLKAWFEEAGWSVWIDRDISLGEDWAHRIRKELESARIVVVLWGAEARRSEWVQREAIAAQQSNRLVQVHATGLPLLAPFDTIQAVRMQSWSGESGHSERIKLLSTIASRLGTTLPVHLGVVTPDEDLTAYQAAIGEASNLRFIIVPARLSECDFSVTVVPATFRTSMRSGDASRQCSLYCVRMLERPTIGRAFCIA